MANLGDAHGDWYWCFEHQRAEKLGELDGDDRMGPYPTREAAEHWRDLVEARNEAWEDEDDA
ncbi:MAG: hypothetical protein J2P58_06640 [Acidimicrobiaceae bacterium]|nr:hypothetical protein [Acidimicrobiaceae bacterium]MBO0747741.1 hypothetical protein [Acidimicrobiaceae bacterium]